MKSRIFTISCLLFICSFACAQIDTIIQHFDANTRSTPEEILYKLRIVNDRKELQKGLTIWLFQEELKTVYQATTDEKGKAYFLIPNGKDYDLNFKNDKKYKIVSLPPTPYLIRTSTVTYVSNQENFTEWVKNDTIYQSIPTGQYATTKRVLAKVNLKNYSNQSLVDESIFFQVKNSTTVYAAKTDKNGQTTLMLPKANTYYLNFKYYEKADSISYGDDKEVYVLNVDYQYFGSKAIEKREKQRLIDMKKREEAYKSYLKELSKTRFYTSIYSISSQFFTLGNTKKAVDLINKEAQKAKEALKTDPTYFETTNKPICAAFQRIKNNNNWHNKLVVTDLTGSMSPYMDQVLVWHQLNAAGDDNNQYLFFNDGRIREKNGKKIEGNGGLFYTNDPKLDNVLKTMQRTTSHGNGGDSPENDIEAILGALKMSDRFDELILIADNYSPIKDKKLMRHLVQKEIPIRIVLAGYRGIIHEDYLDLAYKTGGSLHTLTDDVNGLYALKDGQSIKIDGKHYRISRGRFLLESRL